jgi:hypothetical protein
MLSEFKRKTNIGVGFGWLLLILGRLLAYGAHAPRQAVGYIVMLLGGGLFIWGCAQYAKAKGQSRYCGALGALNVIGLLILYFLPDRNKEAAKI